ncbi:alpha/beta fold hydrolase [Nocardia grenadensis]|uniref:alpha/beta fold hydrolase n=1 Tax=Nocardia grenadensis TaxID=931537 RepID=UPI000ADF3834|nr:alpha/beta fold hydrolase [Nocardia grenadensis]
MAQMEGAAHTRTASVTAVGPVVVRPDGTALAYQVSGPATAPPLLLLPGQANSHRWWDGVRPGLARNFRTITFDYRGTGDTEADDTEAAGWTTELFATDAAAVLDALSCPSAHIYATSMGGRVAQWLAARYPERVQRLVLACTSPGGRLAQERGPEIRRLLADPDPRRRGAVLLELMYTPAWSAAPPRRSTLLGDPRMTARATRGHLRASNRHDASAVLGEIRARTLVLHGDDDRMVPVENAELLAAAVPDAVVEIFPGGRHGFFDEFPAVGERVTEFLLPGS